MHPDGHEFCYVLEDTVRGYGIKDKRNTAIPATTNDDTYFLRVRESPTYGAVATIFTEEVSGKPILNYGGVSFSYIRCHGGNDEEDTEGCLLVNRNRSVEKMSAWGKMKEELSKEVAKLESEGLDVRLRITNLRQGS